MGSPARGGDGLDWERAVQRQVAGGVFAPAFVRADHGVRRTPRTARE